MENMKAIFKIISVGALAAASVIFYSCDEPASEQEWGIAKVYMPQASLQSGSNHNYVVPSGTNGFNKNYIIDNNSLNVVLGVYRSGLQPLEGFSVDIGTRADTVNQLLSDGVLADAILLPEDAYELPATISVPGGQREATFYLSINREKLQADHPEAAGMDLVLAVNIANPSRYELNQSLSTTIVIIRDWESIE